MMRDIGYFYEWVAEGAAFGIKAFFALIIFAMLCAAVVGLLGLGARLIKEADDANENEMRR